MIDYTRASISARLRIATEPKTEAERRACAVDMSSEAITGRLKEVSELNRLCQALRKSKVIATSIRE